MPTITTRGAISAYAFGLGSSQGVNYYIGQVYLGSNTQFGNTAGLAIDSADNVYIPVQVNYSGSGADVFRLSKNAVLGPNVNLYSAYQSSQSSSVSVLQSSNLLIWGLNYNNVDTQLSSYSLPALTSINNPALKWQAPGSRNMTVTSIDVNSSNKIFTVNPAVIPCCCSPTYEIWYSGFDSSLNRTFTKYLNNAQWYGSDFGVLIAADTLTTGFYLSWKDSSNYFTLAKFDSNGNFLSGIRWQPSGGNNSYLRANALRVDSSGNIYFAGGTSNSGGTPIGYLAKFNSSMSYQWGKTLSSDGSPQQYFNYWTAITIDSSGYIYVCGGNYNYPQNMIAKYDSSGNLQWQRAIKLTTTFPGTAQFDLFGIGIDSVGALWVTGRYYNNSYSSTFFMKVPNDGTKTGTYSIGTGIGPAYAVYSINGGTAATANYASYVQPGYSSSTGGVTQGTGSTPTTLPVGVIATKM